MSSRVLVVDDFQPNVKLLAARLTAEYFDVKVAMSGPECLDICGKGEVDVVLLDVMMPGMDGFEVCRQLKAEPETAHVPVVMVTALDQPSDRLRGLQAGADDFLTKPVDELALIARVRSLTRLKLVVDELRGRAATAVSLGIRNPINDALAYNGENGRILIVDDRPGSAERLATTLRESHDVDVETAAPEALVKLAAGHHDLLMVSLGLETSDALRLCSQVRALERTRQLPIVAIADVEDRGRILRGFELGINDYLNRPVERSELVARVRTQVRRKRYLDNLRDSLQTSIEMAVFDALTGLHNRRFLENSLKGLFERCANKGKPLSMMILDIDHFKRINDTHGHDAGDEILRQFAERVKTVVRLNDVVCRLGGEEFVIVMPDTTMTVAHKIAERVRRQVHADPFPVSAGGAQVAVTVSIGVSDRGFDAVHDGMFKRADQALYRSKNEGRNRVTAAAA